MQGFMFHTRGSKGSSLRASGTFEGQEKAESGAQETKSSEDNIQVEGARGSQSHQPGQRIQVLFFCVERSEQGSNHI